MSNATQRKELAIRFEQFARKLFEFYDMKTSNPGLPDTGFDFIAHTKNEQSAAVEVKLYWSIDAPKAPLRRSFQQVLGAANSSYLDKAILVSNAKSDEEIRSFLRLNPKIIFYDYEVIWNLCLGFPDLMKEFQEIANAAFEFQDRPVPEPKIVPEVEFLGAVKEPTKAVTEVGDIGVLAKEYCEKLHSLATGDGTALEILASGILQFIFDGELGNWKRQRNSQTKLHRYDMIARVVGRSGFWNALISDFRSRYIIFEFKNYADPISQSEVYSTEKYLMPLAMRGTAILVTRKGANRNAHSVMSGALRESGKLMLCIDDDDICRMLDLRSNGDDPSVVLADRLDDLLEGLER